MWWSPASGHWGDLDCLGETGFEPGTNRCQIQLDTDSGRSFETAAIFVECVGEAQGARGGDLQILDQNYCESELEEAFRVYFS